MKQSISRPIVWNVFAMMVRQRERQRFFARRSSVANIFMSPKSAISCCAFFSLSSVVLQSLSSSSKWAVSSARTLARTFLRYRIFFTTSFIKSTAQLGRFSNDLSSCFFFITLPFQRDIDCFAHYYRPVSKVSPRVRMF